MPLLGLQPRELTIANRSPARALELAHSRGYRLSLQTHKLLGIE